MEINVTVADVESIDLKSPVAERRRYDSDAEDYITTDVTLGEMVAAKVTAKLTADDEYPDLRKRFLSIRDEEIRAAVKPIVEQAIAEPIQKTNSYGEPVGKTTTLRELIIAEANALLSKPADTYSRSGETVLQKHIREQINKLLMKELNEVFAAEKAKVVAAVRAQAAELIAEAVKRGIGS